MLVKSQAIVLYRIRYSDADSIVHLYSRDFGRIAYLVANHRRNRVVNPAMLQPLSIIEYEAEHKGSRTLQRLKETHSLYTFKGIPSDPAKNGISMFLAEILYRVLNEAEASESLFQYLTQSIELLDQCEQATSNFHLVFLIKLSLFLGFHPNMEENHPNWFFDLQAGCFTPARPPHNAWLTPADARLFAKLMDIRFDNMHLYAFSHRQRTDLLRQILDYYRIHLSDFPEIKSLAVLQECFEP